MESDRIGAMLEQDFRCVLDAVGKARLAFPLDSGTLTVDAFARNGGDGKRVPSLDGSVHGISAERGSVAEALYVTTDATLADGTVYQPQRGDKAELFGKTWQIRTAERVGLNRGVLTRVILVSNASRGDRSSVA